MKLIKYISCFLTLLILIGCADNSDLVDFTIDEEALLGEKIAELVVTDPSYSAIPRESNTVVYGYVDSRLNEITSSSFLNKTSFNWTVILLDNDLREAFATPGGYIYVNTGMIFFLENEDEFSGLLAHMVAHVDSSHIVNRLFFEFGINSLKSIANGNEEEALRAVLASVELGANSIEFSRNNENEADSHALMLLSETSQSCTSAGLFVDRIFNVQPTQQARFISAHALEETRLADVQAQAATIGCDDTVDSESADRFRSFRNALP